MGTIQSNLREKEIFERALDLESSEERLGYIKGACAGDSELLARVRTLLQAHEDASRFLPDAAGEGRPTNAVQVPPTEGLGTVIGRYKLLQEIGAGGMGVVYMAEQEEPVRRRVALKIIKLGMDTKSVIARFEAERQALAMMDHPNIAKVLDGGATDAGRPYFVMELVRGIKITEYCDEAKLSTRDRLDLFIKVCQAIQHAHQKGIIHRDIKPSNILVTINDGVAVPKVIDFGIAKATEGRLTDKTLFTQFEAFIGTPAYVSPEQAVMTSLDIDTRSDIYSLGVLLYELLAGSTPFDAKELMASGIDAMRKTIREQEPMRPSTKLSQTLAAANPHSKLSTLHSALPTDLDWIVMKCLEKDRSRRYETANGLASDLQRHLNNEAVLARPASAAYRFQKLVRRNKLVFAAAAGVTAALVLGIVVSTWQAIRATQAKREAVEQRQLANESRERADQNLYDSDMSLAQHAWDDGDLGRTLSLLEAHRPQAGKKNRRSFEWFYFRNLCEGDQRMTLRGHRSAVTCVAFSPDGKRLATGSVGDPVQIWDTATGKILKTLPEQNVLSLAFTPDGQSLGVGGRDQVVVWNLETGRPLFKHEEAMAQFRIAFSSGGTLLVIGKHGGPIFNDGGSAELWDYTSDELKHVFPESGGYVTLSAPGNQLATGNWNQAIKIWDLATGQFVRSLNTHAALAMALSPDGHTLATSYWGPEVELWDVITGLQIGSLANNQHKVWSLAFSPDGRSLATGSADQMVRLWDVATRQQTEQLQGHGSEVMSVAFSADGQSLASGSKDKKAMLWGVHPNPAATTVSNLISRAIFSPDGRMVAAGIGQNRVAIWDVSTLQETALFGGAHDVLAFSSDGSALITQGTNYFLRTFDVATRTVRETIPGRPAGETFFYDTLSPNGQILAVGLADGTLKLSDAKTGVVIAAKPHAYASNVFKLAFSPNGKLLATAGVLAEAEAPCAQVWDTATLRMVAAPPGHTDLVLDVAFSPDGKTLATCSVDDSIKFWDTTTWKEIPSSLRQKEYVSALAFSPNGRTLATACFDGTMKFWNVVTRREVASLKLGPYGFYITFSPDGQTLATQNGDSLRLWRAPVLPDKKQSRQLDG